MKFPRSGGQQIPKKHACPKEQTSNMCGFLIQPFAQAVPSRFHNKGIEWPCEMCVVPGSTADKSILKVPHRYPIPSGTDCGTLTFIATLLNGHPAAAARLVPLVFLIISKCVVVGNLGVASCCPWTYLSAPIE